LHQSGSGDDSPGGSEALEAEMEESVRELDVQEQVGSREAAVWLSAAGVRRGRPVDVHLDIDTGMGRSGFFPDEIEAIREAMSLPGLSIAGVMTHFPTADSSELARTSAQIGAGQPDRLVAGGFRGRLPAGAVQ
jgi:alanine racemase